MVAVGDRVTYDGCYGEVTRLRGGYHADVRFGIDRGRDAKAENVAIADLLPAPPVVTEEEIRQRDPHLLGR